MTGQAEQGLVGAGSDDGGLARADGHAVGEQFAAVDGGEHPQGEVALAHRTAAGEQQQVAVSKRGRAGGLHASEVIGADAQRHGDAARLLDQGRQRGGIDVADLARRRRLVGRHQFVAGGEDGHPRPTMHRNRCQAEAGEHAQVLGPQPVAAGEDAVAGAAVLTGANDILARGHRPEHGHRGRVEQAGVFDHDHRVRLVRQLPAGPDARRLARSQGEGLARFAHGDFADHGEQGHLGFRAAEGVGRAHRVAVHGGAGKGRQQFPGDHVRSQYPAERRREGHGFAGKRREPVEQGRTLAGADQFEEVLHGRCLLVRERGGWRAHKKGGRRRGDGRLLCRYPG